MKKLSLSAAAALLAAPAMSHEGHAAAREIGFLHWLTETDHVLAIGLTLAVVVAGAVVLRRSRRG